MSIKLRLALILLMALSLVVSSAVGCRGEGESCTNSHECCEYPRRFCKNIYIRTVNIFQTPYISQCRNTHE
ncbi:hypothetical protein BsWGS_07608 [Bradybaena similaris]